MADARTPPPVARHPPPVRNYTEYGDCLTPTRPREDDDDSPERPPDDDDCSDQLPIPERG